MASSVIIALNIITSTAVYNIALKGEGDAKVPNRVKKIIHKMRKKLFIPVNYYIHSHSDENEDGAIEMLTTEEIEQQKMLRKQRKRKTNWLLLAATIDRILFIIYLLLNIFISIFIFVHPI